MFNNKIIQITTLHHHHQEQQNPSSPQKNNNNKTNPVSWKKTFSKSNYLFVQQRGNFDGMIIIQWAELANLSAGILTQNLHIFSSSKNNNKKQSSEWEYLFIKFILYRCWDCQMANRTAHSNAAKLAGDDSAHRLYASSLPIPGGLTVNSISSETTWYTIQCMDQQIHRSVNQISQPISQSNSWMNKSTHPLNLFF